MTDKTTGDLDAAAALDGTELVHVVQGGNSRKATLAEVAGAASVVLADIDLSARDLRIAQNPLILTDIDAYTEIHGTIYATHGSDAGISAHVSTDNGANYSTGASDYGVSGFLLSGASAITNVTNTALDFLPLFPPVAEAWCNFKITQHWNSNARTIAEYYSGGTTAGASRHFIANRRAASLVNALRIFSANAHTGGRLTIVGFR
jgi:hypothetical protein